MIAIEEVQGFDETVEFSFACFGIADIVGYVGDDLFALRSAIEIDLLILQKVIDFSGFSSQVQECGVFT